MGDFSFWKRPGRYRIRIYFEDKTVESCPFVISSHRIASQTGPLAVRFFYIQRCGCEVPGWHSPCHLDDGRFPDGTHHDLSGGWHDAGDYNKYNGYTPLSVYALARFAGSEADRLGDEPPGFPSPLDEALWGAEWLKKCWNPDSNLLAGMVFSGYGYWGPPEEETDNIPGSGDDRPVLALGWNELELAAAAFAVLARKTGSSVWTDICRDMWETVLSQPAFDNDLNRGKRLLAAVEIHRLFEETESSSEAHSYASSLCDSQAADGSWNVWPMLDLGLVPAALAEFLRVFPSSSLKPEIQQSLEKFFLLWDTQRVAPFHIPKWDKDHIFYPYHPGEWYAGQNSMYLSLAWAGFCMENSLPHPLAQEAEIRAYGCLDWILGANPLEICMMEGAGTIHLARYHHRYESIDNGLYGHVPGAICNGYVRASPSSDTPFLDIAGNAWQTNEPWLPHNAYFLLALSEYERNSHRKKRIRKR
ncbi:MAG: glycoside hydrolase family 9 protein [Candidatus Aminicenantes bacterium]|nr:glycoside hydrolase family 9 protein [Candidatus Aminicenantes bacterium]